MNDFFEVIRVSAAICMLTIGSLQDLRFRQVSDYLWMGFGIFAIILFFIQLDDSLFLNSIFLSMIFLVPTSLVLWYFGLFGGADALALIVLSSLAPFATFTDETITPFTILVNASLAIVGFLFFNLFRNLRKIFQNEKIFKDFEESTTNKILACLFGTISKNPKFCFPMQEIIDGKKKFTFRIHHAENTRYCDEPNSWVSPGMPFIIFIMVGFLLQIVFGDIIFSNALFN
jgi:preflagellin peptidase FlaK